MHLLKWLGARWTGILPTRSAPTCWREPRVRSRALGFNGGLDPGLPSCKRHTLSEQSPPQRLADFLTTLLSRLIPRSAKAGHESRTKIASTNLRRDEIVMRGFMP